MLRRRQFLVLSLTLFLPFIPDCCPGIANPCRAQSPKVVEVGIVATLFQDYPRTTQKLILAPFGALVQSQTDLACVPCIIEDPITLGKEMNQGKIGIGIFNGYEFAWAQQKFPQLKPLMIAVVGQPHPVAYLVTRKEGKISNFEDLAGKKVGLPKRSRSHCRLFLQREYQRQGEVGKTGFHIHHCANIEAGLDDVVRGKLAAAVVDDLSFESYKEIKPGCHGELKIVKRSLIFPAGVIAYCDGKLNDKTLKAFREGMLKAKDNERGRMLMGLWRVTTFENIPDDYQKLLSNIRRAYPAADMMLTSPAKGSANGDD